MSNCFNDYHSRLQNYRVNIPVNHFFIFCVYISSFDIIIGSGNLIPYQANFAWILKIIFSNLLPHWLWGRNTPANLRIKKAIRRLTRLYEHLPDVFITTYIESFKIIIFNMPYCMLVSQWPGKCSRDRKCTHWICKNSKKGIFLISAANLDPSSSNVCTCCCSTFWVSVTKLLSVFFIFITKRNVKLNFKSVKQETYFYHSAIFLLFLLLKSPFKFLQRSTRWQYWNLAVLFL